MGDLLSIAGICKSYERGGRFIVVLDGVSLEVAAGEVVAVVGRRFGGKSTLLQIVAGLEAPDAGTVTLAGQPIRVHRRRSVREWWAARRAGLHDPALGRDMVFVSGDGPYQELDVCKFVGAPLAVTGAGGSAMFRCSRAERSSGSARATASAAAGASSRTISGRWSGSRGRSPAARSSSSSMTCSTRTAGAIPPGSRTSCTRCSKSAERPCGVLLSAGYPETAIVLANRVCALTQKGTLAHGTGPRPDAPPARLFPSAKPFET